MAISFWRRPSWRRLRRIRYSSDSQTSLVTERSGSSGAFGGQAGVGQRLTGAGLGERAHGTDGGGDGGHSL